MKCSPNTFLPASLLAVARTILSKIECARHQKRSLPQIGIKRTLASDHWLHTKMMSWSVDFFRARFEAAMGSFV